MCRVGRTDAVRLRRSGDRRSRIPETRSLEGSAEGSCLESHTQMNSHSGALSQLHRSSLVCARKERNIGVHDDLHKEYVHAEKIPVYVGWLQIPIEYICTTARGTLTLIYYCITIYSSPLTHCSVQGREDGRCTSAQVWGQAVPHSWNSKPVGHSGTGTEVVGLWPRTKQRVHRNNASRELRPILL